MKNRSGAALVLLLALSASPARSAITFEDVSSEAGIDGGGTTFGASWGDFNGDGKPDVWVSNHNARPSLYVNQGDGAFVEVASQVWSADPEADTHGAAWADFDNDGDQDLIETVDVVVAENMCIGCGRNHFFVNENGRLREQGAQYGLDRPAAEARTPLWLDADGDGRLDVAVVNKVGRGTEPVQLYRFRDHSFISANAAYGIGMAPGLLASAQQRVASWLSADTEPQPVLSLNPNIGFAQLADLDNDNRVELVVFSRMTRVYSMTQIPHSDITEELGLPGQTDVSDVAIGDFNGDGRADLYVLHGPLPYNLSQMATISDHEISGSLSGHKANIDNELAQGIRFRATGTLRFRLEPEWFSTRHIAVGHDDLIPLSREFTLSTDDPGVAGVPPPGKRGQGTLRIGYDPESGYWTVQNAAPWALVDFIISSETPIRDFEYLNWNGFEETGGNRLFFGTESGFVPSDSLPRDKPHLSCHSAVTQDFDNDMDLDLYLVCAGPAGNLPNRLYENDGAGNFSLVADAGGARGATQGRGDVVAAADYDGNGYVDLFVTNGFDPTSPFVESGPHELFANRGAGNHWLEIDLVGTHTNRDGIGAVVIVESGGVRQKREQGGGMHLHAQSHARLHFGLGSRELADSVTVYWPSGVEQRLEEVKADQILRIIEPDHGEG